MPLPPLVDPAAEISDAERTRTARHAVLPGFGEIGQRRLRAATVAVVGAGGLGSPVVLALAAAGVGWLVVIDDDVVEASNLQRQIIHGIADLGAPKVDSAVRAAATLSPETVVAAIRERLEPATATNLLRGADLVIDGSDSFSTRRIVADACEALGLPLVWGTIQGYDAQVTVFWSAPPAGTAALRLDDLYPSGSTGEPPSCAQAGVLGALCLQVGGVMAVEAIKLITGIGEVLLGRLLVVEALTMRVSELPLRAVAVGASAQASAAGSPEHPPQTSARSGAPARPQPPAPRDYDPVVDAGGHFVDVREPDEYEVDGLPGASSLPLSELLQLEHDPGSLTARLRRLADEGAGTEQAPLNLYCVSATRARRAALLLAPLGIEVRVVQTPELNALRAPAGTASASSRESAAQNGASS